MKKFLAALAAGALAVCGLLVSAQPATAHDVLVHTDPAHNQILESTPEQLTLTFNNEIIDLEGANLVEVRDAADATIVTTAPQVSGTTVTQQLRELSADSVYRVVWRVVSSDGHPIEGSFNFGVGSVTEVDLAQLPAPINVAANALELSPELAASQQQIAVTTPAEQEAQNADTAAAATAAAPVVAISITAVLVAVLVIACVIWYTRTQRKS